MPTKLFILVFVASPLDYARYRHTALHFQFDSVEPTPLEKPEQGGTTGGNGSPESYSNSNIRSSVMEVIGSTGFFSVEERVNWEIPVSSSNIAGIIPVSEIPASVPISTLRDTISSTPIPDDETGEGDWNSQNWIGDALGRLVSARYLDAAARDRGLDRMVDVVTEAGDERVV